MESHNNIRYTFLRTWPILMMIMLGVFVVKGETTDIKQVYVDSISQEQETYNVVQYLITELERKPESLTNTIDKIIKASESLEKVGQYGEAIHLLKKAINHLTSHSQEFPQREMFDLYNSLGVVYMRLRDNKRASDAYLKALNIAENIKSDSCIASINNNLGEFYLNQGDLEKTKKSLENALEINLKLKRPSYVRVNYTNLGIVYYQEKNYKKSEEYYQKALSLIDSNDVASLAVLNLNISQIYKDKGQYKVAEKYLKSGLELLKDTPNKIATHKLRLVLAKCLSYQNKTEEALKNANQALALSDQMGISGKKAETYLTLTDIYLIIGDSTKALEYLLQYEHISDSINSRENSEALNRLLSVYEVELLKKEKLELEQTNKINKLTVGKQRLVILGGVFILALLTLLLLVVFRKLKTDKAKNKLLNHQREQLLEHEKKQFEQQSQEMKQEINFKNRQLTTHTLTQVASNEFQKKISQTLSTIKKHVNLKQSKDALRQIDQLVVEIRHNSNSYISDEFKTYFDSVHPSFFKNLSIYNPELTQNELRLCAFLRMGLSTKEIASLTFREVRSVESARNRLRKKLNVSKEVSIQMYLSEF